MYMYMYIMLLLMYCHLKLIVDSSLMNESICHSLNYCVLQLKRDQPLTIKITIDSLYLDSIVVIC